MYLKKRFKGADILDISLTSTMEESEKQASIDSYMIGFI